MLALMSVSQIFAAHASTGNSGGAPFPYVGVGQTNGTCQYFSLFSSCLSVTNARVLNGGLGAIINASESGNNGNTEGTAFSVSWRTTDNPNIWSGCCASGDKIFFDVVLHGHIAFAGGANALIRVAAQRTGVPCQYWATNCFMWEWYANTPPPAVPPYNNDVLSVLCPNTSSCDQPLDVNGPINGIYKRFYLDSSIFSNSGPIEIQITTLANSALDRSYATVDFGTTGYYVGILDVGWIHQTPPVAPTIASGVGTPNGAYTGSIHPTVCWNGVSDIGIITQYNVQIASDSGFSNIVASKTVPEVGAAIDCYTPTATTFTDARYFWRVNDNDYLGQTSPWSSTYNFYVDTTPPTAPVLTSPANNVYTNNNRPTLSWNPSTDPGPTPSGVNSYFIEVSTSASFSSYQSNQIPGTSVQTNALAEGLWYWRVKAIDNVGNNGPWSTVLQFTVDVTPPSIPVLQSPATGTISTSQSQTLSWSAATDNFGVSSYTLQVDTSSAFNSASLITRTITGTSYSLTLSPNTYYWRVQAVDLAGNVGGWSSVFTLSISDFSLTVTPNPLNVNTGTSGSWTVAVGALFGFTGTISFTDNVPSGLVCTSFNPPSVTLTSSVTGAASTLSCSGPTNQYSVTVTAGTTGGPSHSQTATFNSQDFTINPTQSSVTTFMNTLATTAINIGSLASFAGSVTLTWTVSPANGFSCSMGPNPVTAPGSTNLSCSGPAGTYTVTVTGTSGSLSHQTQVTFTVKGFSLTASPSSLTIAEGRTAQITIQATSLTGYTGSITLSTNLYCATVTFSKTTLTLTAGGTDSAIMYLTPSTDCYANTWTANVSGVDSANSISSSTYVNYTTQDFTIGFPYSVVGIADGYTLSQPVTFYSNNGYAGTVNPNPPQPFSCTPPFYLTTCVNWSFDSSPLTLTAGGSVARQLSITPQYVGSGYWTLSASDGYITRSTKIWVSYNDYNVSLSSNPVNLYIGQSSGVYVQINPYLGIPLTNATIVGTNVSNSCITIYPPNPKFFNLGPSQFILVPITPSSSCTPGTYQATITITGVSNHSYDKSITFTIVLSTMPSGGGGGSVAAGTLITLADGSRIPVQNLQAGMKLLSFDMTTHQYVTTTLDKFVAVMTHNQIVIQTGTGKPLIVDQNPAQKLYVMHPGATSWVLLSVTELKVGDSLYDPMTNTWVPVTNIHYQNDGNHMMYDLYPSGPGNYIANGFLDPLKM